MKHFIISDVIQERFSDGWLDVKYVVNLRSLNIENITGENMCKISYETKMIPVTSLSELTLANYDNNGITGIVVKDSYKESSIAIQGMLLSTAFGSEKDVNKIQELLNDFYFKQSFISGNIYQTTNWETLKLE